MSIRRIQILGEGQIVRVDELMTVDAASKLVDELWGEDLYIEAKVVEQEIRKTVQVGRHVFWESVWIGSIRDLDNKAYEAYLAARFKGKKETYTCAY